MSTRTAQRDTMTLVEHREYLAQIGKAGGKSKSKAKRDAARKNAAKARKAKKPLYPPCPDFHAHVWRADGRCWGAKCRDKYPDLLRLSKSEVAAIRKKLKAK